MALPAFMSLLGLCHNYVVHNYEAHMGNWFFAFLAMSIVWIVNKGLSNGKSNDVL